LSTDLAPGFEHILPLAFDHASLIGPLVPTSPSW
jgi:hypothetical protein